MCITLLYNSKTWAFSEIIIPVIFSFPLSFIITCSFCFVLVFIYMHATNITSILLYTHFLNLSVIMMCSTVNMYIGFYTLHMLFFFLGFCLFIHERHREREAET